MPLRTNNTKGTRHCLSMLLHEDWNVRREREKGKVLQIKTVYSVLGMFDRRKRYSAYCGLKKESVPFIKAGRIDTR